ncbi:LysM peptidoglycan-binding domain-containing protein [Nocardia australiensis]|uniref:LysM peptidoglycan-binding domain-containing protein n=1 Tax=Nocardia australiensis TaxID=2887191 RepID=UPI001D14E43F|nr:LysM domain-containing protein [Nocardia australiensis]
MNDKRIAALQGRPTTAILGGIAHSASASVVAWQFLPWVGRRVRVVAGVAAVSAVLSVMTIGSANATPTPIPIPGCTKVVMVMPTDTSLLQLSADNGITVAQLLEWNARLRPDGLNLDVGSPLCVAV